MRTLKRPYIQVQQESGFSYGGNQSWFPYRFLQKTGCGVIGASDVLLYLQGREKLSKEEYVAFAKKLWMKYLPVIPGFGMNGLTLMIGMNRYFFRNKMPYRACWMISGRKMLGRIDRMLSKDLPVILSVGPNFPMFWGKEKLDFYTRIANGSYHPAVKTKAHFVTVTGRDGMWLRISSWGKEYYIDIREYREYVKNSSSSLVSNVIYIKK